MVERLRTALIRDNALEVVTSGHGEEAIRLLSKREFEVVLIDLLLLLRDGYGVIEFLREHPPAQVRVVLVLADPAQELTGALAPLVVHATVAKPIDTGAMARLIRNIVDDAAAAS
jgi:CheY-like chemotaxis protein